MKRKNWVYKLKIYRMCPSCDKSFRANTFNHTYCCKECCIKFRLKIGREKYRRKKHQLGKCYICNSNENLHVHHIIQQSEGGKETIILCNNHHNLIHKLMSMLTIKGYKIVKIKNIL